jgi:hypothetical protein
MKSYILLIFVVAFYVPLLASEKVRMFAMVSILAPDKLKKFVSVL